MRSWSATAVAEAAGAELQSGPPEIRGPASVVIDSRDVGEHQLFVGLPGTATHGGVFAPQALAQRCWGVLVGPEHAQAAQAAASREQAVLVAEQPLSALQALATGWRRHLGAGVIGVTGSTGKTSTKELLAVLLAPHRRTQASRANFNTEIGLPLEICNTPEGTEALILEMGMRGPGQIAELAAIAEPDVAVIVSIGPVHLELLGSLEAIAAAKSELIAGLSAGGTAVIPADEPLLEPHLRAEVETIRFGEGGDVRMIAEDGERVELDMRGQLVSLEVTFTQAHLRLNLLAAVAAAGAIGVIPQGRVQFEVGPGRGRRLAAPGGITVIDDCYNANPMSMRAALEDLARSQTGAPEDGGRRVAVLGDMLELGPEERRFHEEVGRVANAAGVDLLITVGPLAAAIADTFEHGSAYPTAEAAEAAALVQELVEPGDCVLVKASNGVGLKLVVDTLTLGAD